MLFNKRDWKTCTGNGTVYILIWVNQFLRIATETTNIFSVRPFGTTPY